MFQRYFSVRTKAFPAVLQSQVETPFELHPARSLESRPPRPAQSSASDRPQDRSPRTPRPVCSGSEFPTAPIDSVSEVEAGFLREPDTPSSEFHEQVQRVLWPTPPP